MSDSPDSSPAEPTNADLMAFMTASFGHVMTEISGVKADVAALDRKVDGLDSKTDVMESSLRGEIRAAEARLARKFDDAQQAMRTAKEDVARHLDDPNAHPHRHAA